LLALAQLFDLDRVYQFKRRGGNLCSQADGFYAKAAEDDNEAASLPETTSAVRPGCTSDDLLAWYLLEVNICLGKASEYPSANSFRSRNVERLICLWRACHGLMSSQRKKVASRARRHLDGKGKFAF
jgi:hypothetical protein